ncbi:TPA: hypothetical protein HA231_03170 [Candidatus Woesearchaeota archaeon]|nr:hypothetical protein [Candidatus Woesearchaeota archaeon]
MICAVCEKGKLKKGSIREVMFGVDLGEFPALVCSNCKESFTDEETTRRIQQIARKKKLWGLGRTTKIAKAGNSMMVRIPKPIASFLRLKIGQETFIHPEKDKLVIEAK